MKLSAIRPYVLNCFLLTIPIMVWNVALTDSLPKAFQPDVFWHDIPKVVVLGENSLRVIVFLIAYLMPLSVRTRTQKLGLAVYLAGILLYFVAWLPLLYWPDQAWSNSLLGFLAPAITPVVWLLGIGLIGEKLYVAIPYNRWIFISLSVLFLVFHNYHTLLIYNRLH